MQPVSVLAHNFFGGVYAKTCVIEEGFEVKQHAHNYDHMSILSEGCAVVWRDGEQETYYAPAVIKMPAGVEHSIEAVNGRAVWFCIHKTDETDVTKVDDVLIQKKSANMVDTGLTVDISEIYDLKKSLKKHPEIWNQHTLRTESPDSPHHGCDDIWVRFNDIKNYDPNNPQAFHGEHESVWYKSEIFDYVFQIAIGLCCDIKRQISIGGVLITRIPAGGKVLRHNDAGRWHAEFYKDKYLIPIQANEKQTFNFDGESHVTEVGHIYKFNNLEDHWVDNDSDEDRISLIICMRHD